MAPAPTKPICRSRLPATGQYAPLAPRPRPARWRWGSACCRARCCRTSKPWVAWAGDIRSTGIFCIRESLPCYCHGCRLLSLSDNWMSVCMIWIRQIFRLSLALAILEISLGASTVSAQWLDHNRQWTERDGQGRRSGTMEPGLGGGYVTRDAQGRRLGTGDPGLSGSIIERDAQGRRLGTIEPSPGGGYVTRDAQGRRTGTVEPSSGGGYVLRDAQGRRTGTVEPGPGGSWVERDAQGRRSGTRSPR